MFYIFEMANNHNGDVEHANLIIDRFSDLAEKHRIDAGIKLQLMQLDNYIHNDYVNSDFKYVRIFKDAEMYINDLK